LDRYTAASPSKDCPTPSLVVPLPGARVDDEDDTEDATNTCVDNVDGSKNDEDDADDDGAIADDVLSLPKTVDLCPAPGALAVNT